MTEDINQDMNMEDILSSIKNILEEDQAVVASSPQVEENMPSVAENLDAEIVEDNAVKEDSDDILELSPDMRLEEEINLDAELDGIDVSTSVADDVVELTGVTLGSEDLDTDPFYEEDSISEAENEVAENEAELVQESVSNAEDEEILAPTIETLIENKVEPENVEVPQPIVEAPQPMVEVPQSVNEKTQSTTYSIEEPVVEAKADSAVDVSASIISNFAKLFSREETPKVEEKIVAEKTDTIKIIGEGSKTIEDVVASVIKQIIGEEVANHWKDGLDYNTLAHEEITKQTKEWLDMNLPSIVEKIVKQEIERVMAKVGVNQ